MMYRTCVYTDPEDAISSFEPSKLEPKKAETTTGDGYGAIAPLGHASPDRKVKSDLFRVFGIYSTLKIRFRPLLENSWRHP